MRWGVTALLLTAMIGVSAAADTLFLEASHDATLIEHPRGERANGSGPALFVGRTNQDVNWIRRSLLRFDVAGSLPPKAIIESVRLTLDQASSNNEPVQVRLHRLQAEWREGPSSASGGGGTASLPGDVTWIHTSYDSATWVRPGGQFVGRASAQTEIRGPGSYTWESNPHLVQDVRLWNMAPSRNFGWILIGDEVTRQSVKRFTSRENLDTSRRPVLQITYRLPGDR